MENKFLVLTTKIMRIKYENISFKCKYCFTPDNTCSKNIIDNLPCKTKRNAVNENTPSGEKTIQK